MEMTAKTRHDLSNSPVLGTWLATLSPTSGLFFALELVVAVTVLDYFAGYDVRLAILYLVPIALATWSGGWHSGAAISTASVFCWIFSFRSSNPYSQEI